MKFTPEQRAEAERQLRDTPGSHRVNVPLRPEQRAEYRAMVAAEMAQRDQVVCDSQPLLRALREESFSGELRRAISRSGRQRDELAVAVGLESEQLRNFLWGEEVLPTDAVDRLMAELRILARLEAEPAAPD